MNIQEQAKIIRREGQYITRMEGETDKGFESTFEVKWQGDLWTIIMLNGEVISLDKANDNGLSVELAHRKAVGQKPGCQGKSNGGHAQYYWLYTGSRQRLL